MKSGFIQMLRKRKELIPLISIVALAAVGATSTSLYFLFTKKDVILNKSTNPEPWERLDPSKPQKLVTINQKWRPIKELELVKSIFLFLSILSHPPLILNESCLLALPAPLPSLAESFLPRLDSLILSVRKHFCYTGGV
ncbi:normal mucosa of esophagus-specific gene 1 protein [Oncorhynchus keta]|uniref:normal mucosa of esophagus-specific gene 1 protein n=1 Tax=Oncorhynchus keta TaxID=8018 RepID=UPI00227C03D2|nr:normal mucosa of esophagus-specific gene 1 protein [Oncorhynchus keta]